MAPADTGPRRSGRKSRRLQRLQRAVAAEGMPRAVRAEKARERRTTDAWRVIMLALQLAQTVVLAWTAGRGIGTPWR